MFSCISILSEQLSQLLEETGHIRSIGIDIGHHLVVFIQIHDDSLAVRAGQQPDSAAQAAEDHGHQDNTENDPPSFFFFFFTSL